MCPTGTILVQQQSSSVNATSEFREAFKIMDSDKDGKISSSDLRSFYALSTNTAATDEETMINAMINVADVNKNGFVEYEEFESVLMSKEKSSNNEVDSVMEEVFKSMDRDCDGRLGVEDLRSYLEEVVGISVGGDEIESMIMLAGAGGRGRGGGGVSDGVDFRGFLSILNLDF